MAETADTIVSTSSIASTLPLDIIGEICANIPLCSTGYTHNSAPINVSQVSRRWRDGALGRKEILCDVVEIIGPSPYKNHKRRLADFKQFLKRIGANLPLHITVSPTPLRDVNDDDSEGCIVYDRYKSVTRKIIAQAYMRALKSFRNPWEIVHIDFCIDIPHTPYPVAYDPHLIIDKMPRLKHLFIDYPVAGPDLGVIDLSESTQIQSCTVKGRWSMRISAGLSLSELVYLSVDFGLGNIPETLIPNFYQTLRQMPNLEILVVSLYECLDWHSTHGRILLPALFELVLTLRGEEGFVEDSVPVEGFVNAISCPMLTTLGLHCDYWEEAGDRAPFVTHDGELGLCRFLETSDCSLKSLTIGYDVYYENEVWHAIRGVHCKDLKELRFRNVRFAESSRLPNALYPPHAVRLGDETPILRYLRYLEYYRCRIPDIITTSDIVDMLVKLCTRASLNSFSVSGCNVEGFDDDPKIRAIRVRKCMSNAR